MDLKLLTFGIARDITGEKAVRLTVQPGATVAELRKLLYARYPAFEALHSLLIAVNNEYGQEDTMLREQDEIALIPPVSGG